MMAIPYITGSDLTSSIHGKLLQRETVSDGLRPDIRSLYGDKSWISNLDIVNELAGHRGCVNALSWSKSGSLLASGSDDTNLIIHRYQPEDTTKPFSLATCLSTGHRANIFSVKFMPHSNDRTLISCAGDHEVRVFDLEYSGPAAETSTTSPMAGRGHQTLRQSIAGFHDGVNYLSEGNTNARVYRSHSDRVKRIVTESSPHLFLTCSEDGEVRQFDLRQPSSAYPRHANSRTVIYDAGSNSTGDSPRPLISYKKYHLDLNSISCSASQPHYIVLGGAHLHCFLHDRRMLGRDMLDEKGVKTESDMGTATRCVRRFAPNGKATMTSRDAGHVTACKISDKNPNEMIASWSGNNIYAFDLIRPDNEVVPRATNTSHKSRESKDRKRKRSQQSGREEDVVIRMRYENGQTEDFPVAQSVSQRFINQARGSVLSEAQQRSAQIAKSVVKIRRLIFSLNHGSDLNARRSTVSEVLGLSSTYLQEMDEVMRHWGYPVDPDPPAVTFQTTLRKNRDSSRRFVQACGVLSRVLGGKLQTTHTTPLLKLFGRIESSSLERLDKSREHIFRYGFLKAILLWLDGGRSKLANQFFSSHPIPVARQFELPPEEEEAELQQICNVLMSDVASINERRIVSVDNSRFETDDLRIVFPRESDAVRAFIEAIKLPFSQDDPGANIRTQDKELATRFWGMKVCRGLLMNAGEGVDFAFIDRAFGGLGIPAQETEQSQEDLDPTEDDPVVTSARLIPSESLANSDDSQTDEEHDGPLIDIDDILGDFDAISGDEIEFDEDDTAGEEEDEDDVDDDDNDNDSNDDHEDEGEEDDDDAMDSGIFFRGSTARNALRAQVNKDIPCSSHIRTYQGHCNVKTVKDVNFFGLDDEYVVSGCDSGHLFIWDAKSSKLLNILKGDDEVVNVAQGHPYEPTLAVSGIDHTIKIFSPDIRAQQAARKGIDLGKPPNASSGTSTLRWDRRDRRASSSTTREPPQPIDTEEDLSDIEVIDGGLTSRQRMHQSYTIISQNEVDRVGGNREAFITRDMLNQIAIMMAQRRGGGGAGAAGGLGVANAGDSGDEDEGDEAQIMGAALEDRCATM